MDHNKIDFEVKELHKKIGTNAKRIREEKNFTQLELAIAIGQKSTTIISQAELGTKKTL